MEYLMVSSHKAMKQIAIITTKQNYVWQSMQEVIPAIEKCWELSADISRVINADIEPLREHIKFLMSCDALIITAFNETISRFIINVRKNLNLQIPMVLHLYGHATIACWPEHRFGALECFNKGDAFIGTCEGDLKCMQQIFLNAHTYNIPYPYFPLDEEINKIKGERVFAYVGRISDQKNIHLLLRAYKDFLNISNEYLPLYIYGKEDFLGSPNMGIPSTNCLTNLKKLSDELQISDKVFFKGFKTRDEIYQELGSEHVFVSASTHSDENFGMAAMRSLAIGGKAVISNWGGHKEFKRCHPDRVWVSDVFFENNVPVIGIHHFAECMCKAIRDNSEILNQSLSSYFFPDSVVSQFKDVLKNLYFSDEKLTVSEIALTAFEQQKYFESQGDIQKVFKKYSDPIAQAFLKSYC